MTKKDKRDYEGPLYAPHPDLSEVECYIDEKQVDCKTWGDTVAKAQVDEIESQLDFLSHFDS